MAYRGKQAERVHTQKGLDRFKAEVNLFNLAQGRYGIGVDYRKSTKRNMHEANSISMSNGTGRMILSKKTWLYSDTSEQTGGIT